MQIRKHVSDFWTPLYMYLICHFLPEERNLSLCQLSPGRSSLCDYGWLCNVKWSWGPADIYCAFLISVFFCCCFFFFFWRIDCCPITHCQLIIQQFCLLLTLFISMSGWGEILDHPIRRLIALERISRCVIVPVITSFVVKLLFLDEVFRLILGWFWEICGGIMGWHRAAYCGFWPRPEHKPSAQAEALQQLSFSTINQTHRGPPSHQMGKLSKTQEK